jgi:ankyrin repeat protein
LQDLSRIDPSQDLSLPGTYPKSTSSASISFVTASQGTTWITASGTTWFSAVQFVSLRDSNSVSSSSSRTSILSTATALLQARLSTTAVHRAVRNGDEEKLRILLKYHPDLATRDKHQQTALQWAVELDNQTMIILLLDADPDLALLVPPGDYPRTSPLQYAVEKNNMKTVKILLERGADPSLRPYPTKDTPLLLAILNNNDEMLKILLTAALNPSALSTFSHQTPLHVAVRRFELTGLASLLPDRPKSSPSSTRSEMIIKMLLVAGSDISARDQTGKTPFVIACSVTNAPLAVLRMLLDAGADINEPGLLPLHQTIRNRSPFKTGYNLQYNENRLQLFIDARADVNAVDKDGLSPLHLAVANLRTNMVQILITAGANASAKAPKLGWTPLHYLAGYANGKNFPVENWSDCNEPGYAPLITQETVATAPTRRIILALLLKAGADASIKLSSGDTPLHLAARHGCADTLKARLDAGADPKVKDRNGNTLLHIAFAHHGPTLESLADVLLDARSDIFAQNSEGHTPLYRATIEPWRRSQVVELLQKAGVDVTAAWQRHNLAAARMTSRGISQKSLIKNAARSPGPSNAGD